MADAASVVNRLGMWDDIVPTEICRLEHVARTERKQHEMGRGISSEKSEEIRKVSPLSKEATCCTTLRPTVDPQMIGTKKNTFQLELENRFASLERRDDIDPGPSNDFARGPN